jgi:hypothetical protein
MFELGWLSWVEQASKNLPGGAGRMHIVPTVGHNTTTFLRLQPTARLSCLTSAVRSMIPFNESLEFSWLAACDTSHVT